MLASLSVRHGKRRAQIGVTFVKQIDTEGASLDQGRYIVPLRLMPTAKEGGSIDSAWARSPSYRIGAPRGWWLWSRLPKRVGAWRPWMRPST